MTTTGERLVSLTGSAPATALARWQQSGTGNTTGSRLLSHANLSSGNALYLLTQWLNVLSPFDPNTLLVIPATLRWVWLQARSVMNMPESASMQIVQPTARIMAVEPLAVVEPAARRTILIPKE